MNEDNALRPLPIRLRPSAGETAESYVHRLARANHLRPSYLRRYLATPQGSYGPIQPVKLAAVAGRLLPALLRALPDLASRPRRQHTRRNTEEQKHQNQVRRRALFAAIRRDARAGLSGRAIQRKHKVGGRTVRTALTLATPPARKKMNRQAAVLHELHQHIDAMIETNHDMPVSAVWERLVDDHGATVSYGAIRAYLRAAPPPRTGRHP